MQKVLHIEPRLEKCKEFYFPSSTLTNDAQHKKTHEKSVQCPRCPQKFVSTSALMLHLETKNCGTSSHGESIKEICLVLAFAYSYIRGKHQHDFECPNCGTSFRAMSALLQHAESQTCDKDLAFDRPFGKLLKFLRAQLEEENYEKHASSDQPTATPGPRHAPIISLEQGQAKEENDSKSKSSSSTTGVPKDDKQYCSETSDDDDYITGCTSYSGGIWDYDDVGDNHAFCDNDCGWCGHCADGIL